MFFSKGIDNRVSGLASTYDDYRTVLEIVPTEYFSWILVKKEHPYSQKAFQCDRYMDRCGINAKERSANLCNNTVHIIGQMLLQA